MNPPAHHPREEEAAAYVFGLMDAAERIEFVKSLNADESLRALVDDLSQTAASATLTTTQAAPPAAVRARVLDNIKTIPQDGVRNTSEVVTPRPAPLMPAWLGWAAALLIFGASALFWSNTIDERERYARSNSKMREELQSVLKHSGDYEARTSALEAQVAEMRTTNEALKAQLAMSTSTNTALQQQLADTTKAAETLKQDLAQRTKIAEDMKVELAHLTKANDIAKMQVAMLEATVKEFKQGVAVVVWNSERQEGILKLEKMPPIQSGKDYNLWVIDSSQKTPVNAGVVRVDEKGFAKVDFKPAMAIQQADQFALSVEKEGGAPAGEGPGGPVVLLGK